MVTLTFLPSSGSIASPHLISKSSPNFAMKSFTSFISSIIKPCCSFFSLEKLMESSIFFELKTSLSFSKGELRASSIAFFTRFSPSPYPVLIIATPPSFSTVLTSLKSRFINPCTVIISAILLAATLNVSSAFPKASRTVRSGYISRRRSLLITSSASTCFDISSTPSSA